MTLPSVSTKRVFTRLILPVLSLLSLAAFWPSRLDAQCSLSGAPVAFEPNQPWGGAQRPTDLASGKIERGQNASGSQGSKGGLSHRSTGATPIIGMSREAHFLRNCCFSFVLID